MKITKRQLKKIISEAMYDPMHGIKSLEEPVYNKIMGVLDNPDAQKEDLVNFHMLGDTMSDYKDPRPGMTDDSLAGVKRQMSEFVIADIEAEINKYIPNLKSFLDNTIGSAINSSSKTGWEWNNRTDGIALKINSQIIDLDHVSLLAVEALFGTDSEQHQKAKTLMPYDLFHQVVGGGGVSEIDGEQFISSSNNSLLYYATHWSFAAYLAYKAITTGARANFDGEFIGAQYSNLSRNQQEITFNGSNVLGPAIVNAAKYFDNITIYNAKISKNIKIILQ